MKSLDNKNKIQLLIIILLTISCVWLSYYSHSVLKTEVVYSHIFYLPITLAGLWWGKRGMIATIILSLALIVSHFRAGIGFSNFSADLVRIIMFTIVGVTIGIIRDNIRRVEENTRDFSKKMLEIRENEKAQIAGNLHDELGSLVISVNSCLEISRQMIEQNDLREAKKFIKKAKNKVKNSAKSLKNIAVELKPIDLELIGLSESLKQYCQSLASETNVKILLKIGRHLSNLRHEVSIVLYRVIQESLNNALKHSKAKIISINIYRKDTGIILEINDNGIGFNPKFKLNGNKIGIEGMRQRVEMLLGSFKIQSADNHGCRIIVKIPLAFSETKNDTKKI